MVGQAVVVTDSYGLPDTTGYSTAVIFQVRNDSPQPANQASYRVTLLNASGQTMSVSDATGFSMLGQRTRYLVWQPTDVSGPYPPTMATVQLYPPSGSGLDAPADPSQWTESQTSVNCPTEVVECAIHSTLTYVGQHAQSSPDVTAVITSGGGIIGGYDGGLSNAGTNSEILPNTPTPFDGDTVDIVSSAQSKLNDVKVIFYVDSHNSNDGG